MSSTPLRRRSPRAPVAWCSRGRSGDAELNTSSGELRAGRIDGSAEVKNSNGDTRMGRIAGELRVKAANGDIAMDHVGAGLTAKTANGDIRVGAAAGGSVVAETGYGAVEIGVPDGVAAWLDLNTGYGQLQNKLEAAGPRGRTTTGSRSGRGPVMATSRSGAASRMKREDDDEQYSNRSACAGQTVRRGRRTRRPRP